MTTRSGTPLLAPTIVLALAGWTVEGCGRTSLLAPRAEGALPSDAAAASTTATGGSPSQPASGGVCPNGFTACGKGGDAPCYDLTGSPDHCGACGNACAPGIACQGGHCQQYRCRDVLTFDVLPAVSTVTSNAPSAYGPVLGDFDGDGLLDFVGPTGPPARMGLQLGVGDGTFHAKPVEPASAGSWRAAATDLNGDGRLDLVSISGDKAIATVRMGNGDPSTIFAEGTTYLTPSPPSSLVLADLDGDGHMDLVAGGAKDATTGKPYLRSWRGSASGMLATPVDLSVGAVGSFLVAADWNRDGVLDLLFGTFSLRMLLGRGDGGFDKEVACGLALADGSNCNVVADFDGDQQPDVALCSIGVLLGMNGCNFTSLVSLPEWRATPAQGGQRVDVAASADLNGDGAMDIVSLGYSTVPDADTLAVYAGDGRGGFAAPRTFSVVEGQPFGTIVAGDLNRDGRLDLLVTRSGGWQVLLNTCR